jgi:hypothetical protein
MELDATQIIEGKWYVVGWGKEPFIEDCCDCCLSHTIRYRIHAGRLEVSYRVNRKRTRALRRKNGIKVTRSAI